MLDEPAAYVGEGVEAVQESLSGVKAWLYTSKPWVSLMILGICFLVWLILKRSDKKLAGRYENNPGGRRSVGMIVSVLRYVVLVWGIVTVLQVNGINVSSLVTGLGVIGIIVGFALQEVLQDLVMGVSILWDGFFKVGDVVRFDNRPGDPVVGVVENFSIKVTKLRDVSTGNLLTICNREINQIELLSGKVVLIVPSPYEVEAAVMREVCRTICHRIEKLEGVEDCRFDGTDAFEASQISYRLTMQTSPMIQSAKRREALAVIQDTLTENQISIPFNQLDIHIQK